MTAEGIYQYLPDSWKRALQPIIDGGVDPETVVAAVLAFDAIKRLPTGERAKAIAVVVGLHNIKDKAQ